MTTRRWWRWYCWGEI